MSRPSAPVVTDGVVVLDALTEDDVESHLAGEDEKQAKRFGWYPKRSTVERVRRSITDWREQWASQGPVRTFAVREVPTRELKGGCQLRIRGDLGSVSYWTFPAHRRRGFASRALALLATWALTKAGVEMLEARMDEDNVGSRKVAEAAGFVPVDDVQVSGATAVYLLRRTRD